MIDPKSFIANKPSERPDESIDMEGTYSCPEQGCYEVTYVARFNERDRVARWTCSNGHEGKAMI